MLLRKRQVLLHSEGWTQNWITEQPDSSLMMLHQLPPLFLKLCNTSTNIIILLHYITYYTLYYYIHFIIYYICWTVWDRIPVGMKFSARPDRAWGPPSLLYNG